MGVEKVCKENRSGSRGSRCVDHPSTIYPPFLHVRPMSLCHTSGLVYSRYFVLLKVESLRPRNVLYCVYFSSHLVNHKYL